MYDLVEIQTKDNILLQGLVAYPIKNRDTVIIWVHGLTSNFYSNTSLLNILKVKALENNIGFASFNNRGHDYIGDLKKIDKRNRDGFRYVKSGSGYEKFEDSKYDINAYIKYLFEKFNFKKVILVGQSTGCQKVCYFYNYYPKNISAIVLLSPTSDRLGYQKNINKYTTDIEKIKEVINSGKGEDLQFGYSYFPLTANRLNSLINIGTNEDMFDYDKLKPNMKFYNKIKSPLLVLFGQNDETADRNIENIKIIFDQKNISSYYLSKIITGAGHSFKNYENEVVNDIFQFIKISTNE